MVSLLLYDLPPFLNADKDNSVSRLNVSLRTLCHSLLLLAMCRKSNLGHRWRSILCGHWSITVPCLLPMSLKYAATLIPNSGLISTPRGTTFLVGLTQQTSHPSESGRVGCCSCAYQRGCCPGIGGEPNIHVVVQRKLRRVRRPSSQTACRPKIWLRKLRS